MACSKLMGAVLLTLASALMLGAQSPSLDQFKTMKPRHIGPGTTSGRVTALDGVAKDPNVIYAGTASGGLWKTTNGGVTWSPIFDEQPVLSIGAVAVRQDQPDVVWAGTGEGNPRNSQTSGAGIYRSLDAGRTWKCMGLEGTKAIHRIILHPTDPKVVYVGALGNSWGNSADRGVYKTTNAGETWEKVLYVNDHTGCADLIVDPGNPDKLFAAMWEFGRKPWFFTSGGPGSGLHMTVDGGKTWKKVTDKEGLPKGDLGRIGLGISRSNPLVVYALVEATSNGLYRSQDGGYSWSLVTDKNIGNRPFYYAEIHVDPQDENRLYNLFSEVNVSIDGGATWNTLISWGEGHPDHHAWWMNPLDGRTIVDGNDGGMVISRDRGRSWNFVENLPVGQFYHINFDMDIPYHIYGGLQDNGTLMGPAYAWQEGALFNWQWRELLFGDGFDVVPHPTRPRTGYAMSQGGNVNRYDRETGQTSFIQPIHPQGVPLRFNWNAGMAADPFHPDALYFGSQFLHYSTDQGRSWQLLSPDLTSNNPEKQQQVKSGGITIDATRAENHTTIITIAPSPKDANVVWVGTDDGNVQLTRDHGATWENLSRRLPGFPEGAWVPHIEASPVDAGTAFVVANDYRRDNWQPYAWMTDDFGRSWKRIADDKKVKGHTHCIVQDPVAANLLFLGTEQGLWVSFDKGGNWQQWLHDYPQVSTTDLRIHPREHDLVIGTFGRGIYVLDDITPLREVARQPAILQQRIHAFAPPDAYLVPSPLHPGPHFPSDGAFKGVNRTSMARLSFWCNPAAKSDQTSGDDPFKGKVVVTLFNERGDTVRNFSTTPDSNLVKVKWDLCGRGVKWPSWRDPGQGVDDDSGPLVVPGTYRIRMRLGADISETQIRVLADPRVDIPAADWVAKDSLTQRLERDIKTAHLAFEQLKKMSRTVDACNGVLGELSKEARESLTKEGKALQDSVKAIQHLFAQPQDFKGYDHLTERINGRLGNAAEHVHSSAGRPTATAYLAVEQAEALLRPALARLQRLKEGAWATYKAHLQEARPDPFPDLKPLGLE